MPLRTQLTAVPLQQYIPGLCLSVRHKSSQKRSEPQKRFSLIIHTFEVVLARQTLAMGTSSFCAFEPAFELLSILSRLYIRARFASFRFRSQSCLTSTVAQRLPPRLPLLQNAGHRLLRPSFKGEPRLHRPVLLLASVLLQGRPLLGHVEPCR